MTATPAPRPTQFGRIHPPDEAWLAGNPPEAILEPDLPIIDTHHHLWDRGGHRYFLSDFLADAATGYNVVATVFLECHSMYRAAGPAEMRPVGETEFVAGQAAMSASGMYGPTRVAAGIVGFADLTRGDRVEPVLEAHLRAGGGRFRGVGRERHHRQQRVRGRPAPLPAARVSRRPRAPDPARPLARRVGLPPAARRGGGAGPRPPRREHHSGARGRGARLRPLHRQARRGVRGLEDPDDRAGAVPEREPEARRHDDAPGRLRLPYRA